MAAEITKLQHYHEGRLSDSLVEVFHKMDIMLADGRYSQVFTWSCCFAQIPAPVQDVLVTGMALIE